MTRKMAVAKRTISAAVRPDPHLAHVPYGAQSHAAIAGAESGAHTSFAQHELDAHCRVGRDGEHKGAKLVEVEAVAVGIARGEAAFEALLDALAMVDVIDVVAEEAHRVAHLRPSIPAMHAITRGA